MKRTPLTRSTRLKNKREAPRRKAPERVPHNRIKPKASDGPTPEQERFHASLRGLPCQCGCGRPGECTHHIMARAPGKGPRRDEFFVVRLSHHCHNRGTKSVHLLGSESAFQRETGVDLVAVAVENLHRWREGNAD